MSSPRFRCYRTHDVTGVELGGALKNVLAIACGISDGLGFGSNGRAALITRGLDEITRLAGGVLVRGGEKRAGGKIRCGAAVLCCAVLYHLKHASAPARAIASLSDARPAGVCYPGCSWVWRQPADAGGAGGCGRHCADVHGGPISQPHRGCAAGQGGEAGGHHSHHEGGAGCVWVCRQGGVR